MRKKENAKRVVLETALFASAVLLMALTFHSCQKDEVPDQVTTDQEVVITKSVASGGDCENDCIDPDDPEYFEVQESKTITWGLEKNSKTVEVIYYNTLSDFVIKVMSSNGISDVLMDDVSIKNFEGTIAPDIWQEIALPLAENWVACESWSFELKVAGYGPPACFDVEYKLIGECTTLYTLDLAVFPEGAGTADGAGQYAVGIEIVMTATANDGFVFVNWTDENNIEISNDAFFIYTMPAMNKTLTANFDEEVVSFVCGESTITDVDGNVYNTVLIGNQCWMKQNLKTTKYNDGSNIDYPGSDNAAWASNTTGAYAWYNNNATAYKDVYGALYNFNAVKNASNLCPSGWKVPSDDDWKALETFLGMTVGIDDQGTDNRGTDEGQRLKEANFAHWWYWGDGQFVGTDDYGFTALPGGYRNYSTGEFYSMGYAGGFWTSYNDGPWAFIRILNADNIHIGRYGGPYNNGQSVRCVKD